MNITGGIVESTDTNESTILHRNGILDINTDAKIVSKSKNAVKIVEVTYTANTDTAYKVEHYHQELDGSYILVDTDNIGIYRTGGTNIQKFSDVEASHEIADAIEIASEYGIISGYTDGSFKPNAKISREEAMVMYSRAMDIVGVEELDSDRINNYIDKNLLSDWAYNDVKKTINAGVFNGKTKETIKPKDTFTCAEVAKAIRNLLIVSGLINE